MPECRPQYFAGIKGVLPLAVDGMVEDMIEEVGLTEKRDALSASLSGGQKRKLSVGIALIGDSKVRARAVVWAFLKWTRRSCFWTSPQAAWTPTRAGPLGTFCRCVCVCVWGGGGVLSHVPRAVPQILAGKLSFPRYFDRNAKNLIKKLLTADLTKRFGCLKAGADDIKTHKVPWPL